MPVDFSIKQVPDAVAERLRARAERNHRSLQGELRSILEEAADAQSPLDARGLFERASSRGHVRTGQSVVEMIREMRAERGHTLVARGERRSRRSHK